MLKVLFHVYIVICLKLYRNNFNLFKSVFGIKRGQVINVKKDSIIRKKYRYYRCKSWYWILDNEITLFGR